jgi:ketosteroid isomerase-like protein
LRKLDELTARSLLEQAHDAWCRADIESLLCHYSEDCIYWCNAGSLDGVPYIIEGKADYRTFLRSIVSVAESRSVIDSFVFEDGVGRARIEAYITHRRTGHSLSGTYRQVVTYRGRKIVRCDEYHDAAKMAAFWRMVKCDEAQEAPAHQDDTEK